MITPQHLTDLGFNQDGFWNGGLSNYNGLRVIKKDGYHAVEIGLFEFRHLAVVFTVEHLRWIMDNMKLWENEY